MQICSCEVRLGGDMRRTVVRDEVTVPEIRVLQNIHGADAVINIKPKKTVRDFDHAEHRLELARVYERGGITSTNPDATKGLVARLFGAYGNLPVRLAEIGYNPKAEAERLRKEAENAMTAATALEAAENELFDGDDELTDEERELLNGGAGQREASEASKRAAAKTTVNADDLL